MSFIIVNNKRCGVQILDCTVTLKEEGNDKMVNGLLLNSLFVALSLIYYGDLLKKSPCCRVKERQNRETKKVGI